ncbi:phospholipase A2 inhibitor and Ly6/PLAUR domain-containing protein-like [Gopherus evgoodei]|uniref:phospholipase A2 inhibitor and Ly6/PLAUR domain-containing protein-like n=1 Tax=Gopherus evgoodei TaxID=1825980 RepID=UPI0011CFC862|nr:phospholipase A2 inhibitor and Ly6/PLAUR domain-containing protein-like [Gopherus evgoodei]
MVSFIFCLLPALLATMSAQAENLTCDTCFGQTENCEFAPGTCQDNKATGGCLSVAEDIKLNGTQHTYFYKQCLSSYKSDIKVPISFSVGNGNYVRITNTQCNDTDKCNLAVLRVPTGSTTMNGLQCPTCFALNFDSCNSSVTPCTGNETYCIDFVGFLYKGKCCQPAAVTTTPTTTITTTPNPTQTTCGGVSLALGKFSFALYLPGLTGLLLVKLLS